jgi:hypothetical protein
MVKWHAPPVIPDGISRALSRILSFAGVIVPIV